MKVKNNIFGSKSERANFQKLKNQWGDKYNVYQNLPFLMIMDISRNEVNPIIFDYLLKTSVDYVICDIEDKPIIGIEFDGMQQGVSVGTEYIPNKEADKSRKWRMETKLNVAHECKFPLVVVGDKEFDFLSDTGLTIVDGIIGTITKDRYFKQEFTEDKFNDYIYERFGMTDTDFERLSEDDQDGIVENFGTEVTVVADAQNPIISKRWQIQRKLIDATIHEDGKTKRSNLKSGYMMGGVEKIYEIDSDHFTAGLFWYSHEDFGRVQKLVVLPRFELPNGGYDWMLAKDIAALLAVIEMAELMGVDID